MSRIAPQVTGSCRWTDVSTFSRTARCWSRTCSAPATTGCTRARPPTSSTWPHRRSSRSASSVSVCVSESKRTNKTIAGCMCIDRLAADLSAHLFCEWARLRRRYLLTAARLNFVPNENSWRRRSRGCESAALLFCEIGSFFFICPHAWFAATADINPIWLWIFCKRTQISWRWYGRRFCNASVVRDIAPEWMSCGILWWLKLESDLKGGACVFFSLFSLKYWIKNQFNDFVLLLDAQIYWFNTISPLSGQFKISVIRHKTVKWLKNQGNY